MNSKARAVFVGLAAVFSAGAIGAGSVSWRSEDNYVALQDGEEMGNTGLKPCYGNCINSDPPYVIVGYCFSGEWCCGWVYCDHPSQYSLACCEEDGQCRYDENQDPPGSAWCNVFP